MSTVCYTITGGDFEQAGSASSRLKERLKRLGVEPAALRRAIIAAYEAEMNVVIHARKGVMRAAIRPASLEVHVDDEGPGIPDIEKAMQEGFSTAPPAARELGFGAGMGLPNIKKNSDRFDIRSAIGRGTRLRFAVDLLPHKAPGSARHSVRIAAEVCCQCLRCLHACPTKALRLRAGKPQIMERLCIDCTACLAACETGALTIKSANRMPSPSPDSFLVIPRAFLAQFGHGVRPEQVLEALTSLGFRHVCTTETWRRSLSAAVARYAREEAETRPVISPLCLPVLNLISIRFPSLLKNVAPFLSPVEAAQVEFADRRAVFVASCPAEHTALASENAPEAHTVVTPSQLYHAVLAQVIRGNEPTASHTPPPSEPRSRDVCRVSGISHGTTILEATENGLLEEASVLELFACDQGCFGSPLLPEDPFMARHRWQRAPAGLGAPAKTFRRETPLAPREGIRLDADMSAAIEKLSEIDAIARDLPGRNCGLCGAPTCDALAEDVVLGRAALSACPYLSLGD